MSPRSSDPSETTSEESYMSDIVCEPSQTDVSAAPAPPNETLLEAWYPLISELAAAITSAAPATQKRHNRTDFEEYLLALCELALDEQTLALSVKKFEKAIKSTQPVDTQIRPGRISSDDNERHIQACYLDLEKARKEVKDARHNLNVEIVDQNARVVATLEEVDCILIDHYKSEYRASPTQ